MESRSRLRATSARGHSVHLRVFFSGVAGGFSYGSIYYYLALKAAGATSDNPHSGHQHELHQYPDRPETAKHGYGRCTHPHVESDVCQWPGNAQRFMQALGVAK